jgi:outer membrane lipoprotein-sorting protein
MNKAIKIILVGLLMTASALAQTEAAKPAAAATTPASGDKATTTATASSAALPSAEQLVDKYVTALGGKAAIEKITSTSAKGTLELPAMGVNGTAERLAKAPNKTYMIVSIPSFGDIKQGADGTSAWAQDPNSGQINDISGNQLARAKMAADFYRDLKFKETYSKMTVKGTEKVNSRDAYVVQADSSAGPTTMYFDAQNGLLLRIDSERDGPEGKTMIEEYYDDYRDVDGVKYPYAYRQKNSQYDFTIKFTEVKHNVTIDDAKFAKPAN